MYGIIEKVLVNRPFWPSVRDTRVMPNALTHDSDHSMVVCDIRLRLTNTALRGQRIPPQPRICVASLNNPTKLHVFQAAVRQAAAEWQSGRRASSCDTPPSTHRSCTVLH